VAGSAALPTMTTFRSELRACVTSVLAAVLLLGCGKAVHQPDKPGLRPSTLADIGAVLEMRIGQPSTIYALVRQGLSAKQSPAGRLAALPQSLPLLVVSVLGLPPLAAGRLAEQGDWLGVVSRNSEGKAAWGVAVPVHSGSELIAELTLGVAAPRRAIARKGWTQLDGPNVGAIGVGCLGVASNTLVFGTSCDGVDVLVQRLPAHHTSAPSPHGTRLTLRLLAKRSVLQGVYEHWSDQLWQLVAPLFAASLGSVDAAIEDMLELLDARFSAYLGHIEGGEIVLALQATRLTLEGKLDAPTLPVKAPRKSLCEALGNMPADTRLWLAGAFERGQGARSPDWDTEQGAWENAIVNLMAQTVGEQAVFQAQSDPAADDALQPSQWLVGVRDGQEGRAFWAMFEGTNQARLSAGLRLQGTPVARRHLSREGKPLEWGAAPWRDTGVRVAVGAPLGEQWERWLDSEPLATPIAFGSLPCQGVVAGVVVGSFGELVVARVQEGLELKGFVDVTGQWSTRR
jgi:hypothetical protein